MSETVLSGNATDLRPQTQAKKDLRNTSEKEEAIIKAFSTRFTEIDGLEAQPLGGSQSDPVGNVDVRPDYVLSRAIEVKHSNPLYTGDIAIKEENLKACKYHNALILFVNGMETDNPEYALMRPEKFLEDGYRDEYHSTMARWLPYETFEWGEF